MTASLRRVAAELGAPLGCVLEGGYDVDALAASVCEVVPVLAAAQPPGAEAVELAIDPLAARARERHSEWWPLLAGASS